LFVGLEQLNPVETLGSVEFYEMRIESTSVRALRRKEDRVGIWIHLNGGSGTEQDERSEE
jgi:hypothetical protein